MATRKMTDRAAEAWLSEPVTVHLFRDNGSYKEDKIVTVNGETVRIPRGEGGESSALAGLYPCGEGAGYAGGITSAALDGMLTAEAIINELSNLKG